jgi:L-ascorbate metabolism protein UlaG (beta-lactamase superfamily)
MNMRLSRLFLAALGLLLLFAATVAAGGCAFSAPGYQGERAQLESSWDGERFVNKPYAPHGGFNDLLKWQAKRSQGPWQGAPEAQPGDAPPDRVHGERMRVTFVNHSTLLIQTAGLNILTDPIWSERTSPVSFAGPSRVRPPGIRFEDMPPIDVVLISHNHYDHMDVPTLHELAERDRPRIFAGLGSAAYLAAEGIGGAEDLDWWESRPITDGVTVHFAPAQHFSGRGLFDRDKTLWGAFVVESPGGPWFHAGDTGFGPHFAAIHDRFGAMRLSMLPIGAYRPRWFMEGVHIDPEQAVAAHLVLESAYSVGMHFGTFPLADDGEIEPTRDLDLARTAADLPPERFRVLPFGGAMDVPPLPPAS